MKKFLIICFFGLCLILSGLSLKAGAWLMSYDIEVNYRTLEKELSDTEVEHYNNTILTNKKLKFEEGYQNVRYDKVKETRTKKLFGWETKIDTLESYVKLENCNCN
jgi:hypothetical protein